MNIQMLLVQLFFITACAKYEAVSNPGGGTSVEPPALPSTTTSPSSWAGGAVSLQALQGRWVLPCTAGQTVVMPISGNSVSQSGYRFNNQNCTGDFTFTGATTNPIVLSGPDTAVGDAEDVQMIGAASEYQLIKLSSTLLALGYNAPPLDGTTPSERPLSFFPASFVKEE